MTGMILASYPLESGTDHVPRMTGMILNEIKGCHCAFHVPRMTGMILPRGLDV